jgi:hypothetical protein
MKRLLIALVASLVFSTCSFAQNADEPATKDDILLYLRTMHSHDMMTKLMEAQSTGMRQLFHDQMMKEKGSVPPDFDVHFKKWMDDLIKGMPVDEITQAMIPSYQKHFTHGDVEAMNAFYASPVGQKVLDTLPVVMQEGMQAAMPIMSQYLSEWKERMEKEMKDEKPVKPAGSETPKN